MLVEAEPRDQYDLRRWLCAEGRVQIQVTQMLFGRRLRAGLVEDNFGYCLDWCMGDVALDSPLLDWLLNSMALMVEHRVAQGLDPFEGIPPFSKRKPLTNDLEFLLHLAKERILITELGEASRV